MPKINLKDGERARIEITAAQQREVRNLYNQVYEDCQARIRQIPSSERNATESLQRWRLTTLSNQLKSAYEDMNLQLEKTIRSGMSQVSEAVSKDVGAWTTKAGMSIDGLFSWVPRDVVASLSSGQLYDGDWSLSKAIWGDSRQRLNEINQIVAAGVASNKSAYDIAKDLESYVNPNKQKEWAWSKVYPGTRKVVDYSAQRLARTMVSHAYQQSLLATTKHNPFVSGYRWEASNSDRMCEICEARDGKIFSAEDLPMDHPNGMCTFTVETTESMDDVANRIADWYGGKSDPELDTWLEYLEHK